MRDAHGAQDVVHCVGALGLGVRRRRHSHRGGCLQRLSNGELGVEDVLLLDVRDGVVQALAVATRVLPHGDVVVAEGAAKGEALGPGNLRGEGVEEAGLSRTRRAHDGEQSAGFGGARDAVEDALGLRVGAELLLLLLGGLDGHADVVPPHDDLVPRGGSIADGVVVTARFFLAFPELGADAAERGESDDAGDLDVRRARPQRDARGELQHLRGRVHSGGGNGTTLRQLYPFRESSGRGSSHRKLSNQIRHRQIRGAPGEGSFGATCRSC